jgi:FKBP-type peptidyl-prolyl cis-trans isomerase
MRKHLYTIIAAVLFFTSVNAQKEKEKSKNQKKLETLKDSASYAMGYSVGQTISSRYPGMELDLILKGLADAFETDSAIIKPEYINNLVTTFVKQQARIQAMTNKEAGEKFLKENENKEGVIKTASGLQYIILKQGSGPIPASDNRVKVNYVGTLLNGKEVDNSYKRGKPEEFSVAGVIKGWTEALMLMPVGSTYKLFIPAALAYGENGMGVNVPPNSTLIFEIELLEVL